ncbi:MAG: DUF2911 domain-containing protein [Bacteroidetes bacterium]|nr:DUF2911 domain-containing protein [Bacteroidota bacterium]
MLQQLKTLSAALAITAIGATNVNAQGIKMPASSPSQNIKQAFGLSELVIDYSRPSAKGRVIYGELVPYGAIWRTGANASTKITFGENVLIDGIALPAGTYALYSIPNKDNWELMFYKDLTLGGSVDKYDKANEALRIAVKPKALNDKVETFSIDVTDMTSSSANIELTWEKTKVSFNATVADLDSKVMKSIESSVLKDNRPYSQAATYYYENGKDLKQALEWADKAIAQNPKAYWVVLTKAKIQAKQGDKKGATATAQQVITLAKEAKNDDYVRMAEKLIAENK